MLKTIRQFFDHLAEDREVLSYWLNMIHHCDVIPFGMSAIIWGVPYQEHIVVPTRGFMAYNAMRYWRWQFTETILHRIAYANYANVFVSDIMKATAQWMVSNEELVLGDTIPNVTQRTLEYFGAAIVLTLPDAKSLLDTNNNFTTVYAEAVYHTEGFEPGSIITNDGTLTIPKPGQDDTASQESVLMKHIATTLF